jgi:hypothetical protein
MQFEGCTNDLIIDMPRLSARQTTRLLWILGALAGVGLLVRLWLDLAEEARAAAAADAVRASTAGRRVHHRNVSRNIIESYHAAVKARDGLSEDKFTCVPADDLGKSALSPA